jgi:hypothetical protein
MATKIFKTQTVQSNRTVVDDKLKPTAEIHILVGGPYTDAQGEQHRYGHTALRVKTTTTDRTYDFGRYGRVTGTFDESGDGILRVWSDFQAYISGENYLKRKTTDFGYVVWDHQAAAAIAYLDGLISNAQKLPKSNSTRAVYKLSTDYHALGYNCTTLSMDGARKAIPKIDEGSAAFNKPEDVLTWTEMAALKVNGKPSRIFLPANLETFLNRSFPIKYNSKVVHGG